MSLLPVKILLVDDDEDDFVLTRDLLLELKGQNFQLDWVSSFDEAVEEINRNHHDVYLLDYQLGERNGLELIRATCESSNAPKILLTGQADHEIDLEAMKAGAADYLLKGQIDAALLARSIRYSIEHTRSVRSARESEERYHRLVELSPDAIFVHADNRIVFINSAGVRMFGASSPDELLGRPILNFVHEDFRDSVRNRISKIINEGIAAPFAEEKMRTVDGSIFHVEVAGVPFVYNNSPAVQVVARDISARKLAEQRLLHEAFHDGLTGLPNRALFLEHLKLAIERAKRPNNYIFAVLILDLDRFKNINDSLGHTVGDLLLGNIARRLEDCVRHVDIVARFGGDEFAILLDGIADSSDAVRVADRIQNELGTPLTLSGHDVFTSASIGIALSIRGYSHTEEVVRDADTAMYRAKALGKARHEIFDAHMHAHAVATLRLETDLRRAIDREEFSIHYQPIVSLLTDRLYGFEALVRWNHPEKGLVAPGEFIGVAEETGLIIPLGRWVLYESCRQMKEWQSKYSSANELTLSVNMSGKQFAQPDLYALVQRIIYETGFDPKCLQLEITESSAIENSDATNLVLVQLRKHGIRLSMDDFGTGYSSLSYLHRFPIDTLKIDRSFISSSPNVSGNGIVRTIIMLARDLGMNVVAEGIETLEQLNYLRSLACEFGQGYYFSHPVDVMATEKILASHQNGEVLTPEALNSNLVEELPTSRAVQAES